MFPIVQNINPHILKLALIDPTNVAPTIEAITKWCLNLSLDKWFLYKPDDAIKIGNTITLTIFVVIR